MASSADPRGDRWRALQVMIHLPRLARLYWRLFRDPRVSLWPKVMLVGAVVYVILPFDLIPDTIPFIGEIDDIVVLIAAAHWFLGWCPRDVVREHARDIGNVSV